MSFCLLYKMCDVNLSVLLNMNNTYKKLSINACACVINTSVYMHLFLFVKSCAQLTSAPPTQFRHICLSSRPILLYQPGLPPTLHPIITSQ